jgi:hypothetical protein
MKLYPCSLATAVTAALLLCACSGQVDPGDASGPGGIGAAVEACAQGAVADAPYGTVAELDGLVVGRWARCEGPPQLAGEVLGVEFTEGRVVWPLRRAPGGAVESVQPAPGVGPESWFAIVDPGGHLRLVFAWASSPTKTRSSIVIDGPGFFDGAEQMFVPYAPVGASYVRLEP